MMVVGEVFTHVDWDVKIVTIDLRMLSRKMRKRG